MSENNYVLFDREGQIAILTFNRPKALNALNRELLQELDQILDQIAQNDEIRCVIVTGAGEKSFVAGADIKEMQAYSVMEARALALFGQSVCTKLERLPKPTIAAVNGFALGGGCELAMACDIRIAAAHAKFGQPEVKLGITAGYGGTQRLPRLVGSGIAKEILFTGDMISAERALSIGLVNHVVEKEELLNFSRSMAERICKQSKCAVGLSKQAVNEGTQMDLDRGLKYEAEMFALSFSVDEHAEGFQAFIEKRSPKF
ncbi:enoyl-CoA hydratase-related protein [Fodinisporobacter ferrooxydans]|uniref:Enoyl-CoA hydratase-related protein n=1 Tax=Fodinisporobacter ferrooxydans TaxID=2901836 RepID=A0ABY4CNP6_9BACL|nr:enoyl-CoA hydratase-related protein [Alicyclobacillaceae bacterium MYW30-H2]